jgi:tryptophan synthase beta chain
MTSDNFNFPDKEGFFGEYGGKFVPETLMYALEELENTYNQLKDNSEFIDEFYKDLSAFVGRPYILPKDSQIIMVLVQYG